MLRIMFGVDSLQIIGLEESNERWKMFTEMRKASGERMKTNSQTLRNTKEPSKCLFEANALHSSTESSIKLYGYKI